MHHQRHRDLKEVDKMMKCKALSIVLLVISLVLAFGLVPSESSNTLEGEHVRAEGELQYPYPSDYKDFKGPRKIVLEFYLKDKAEVNGKAQMQRVDMLDPCLSANVEMTFHARLEKATKQDDEVDKDRKEDSTKKYVWGSFVDGKVRITQTWKLASKEKSCTEQATKSGIKPGKEESRTVTWDGEIFDSGIVYGVINDNVGLPTLFRTNIGKISKPDLPPPKKFSFKLAHYHPFQWFKTYDRKGIYPRSHPQAGEIRAVLKDKDNKGVSGNRVFFYVVSGTDLEGVFQPYNPFTSKKSLLCPSSWHKLYPALKDAKMESYFACAITDNEGVARINYMATRYIDPVSFAKKLVKNGKLEGTIKAVIADFEQESRKLKKIKYEASVDVTFTSVAMIMEIKGEGRPDNFVSSEIPTSGPGRVRVKRILVRPTFDYKSVEANFELMPGDIIDIDGKTDVEIAWVHGDWIRAFVPDKVPFKEGEVRIRNLPIVLLASAFDSGFRTNFEKLENILGGVTVSKGISTLVEAVPVAGPMATFVADVMKQYKDLDLTKISLVTKIRLRSKVLVDQSKGFIEVYNMEGSPDIRTVTGKQITLRDRQMVAISDDGSIVKTEFFDPEKIEKQFLGNTTWDAATVASVPEPSPKTDDGGLTIGKLPPATIKSPEPPQEPKSPPGQISTRPWPQREVVQQYDSGTINWSKGTITAVGIGAPPPNAVNMAQARAMARRAAIVVARRNLLELVQGVQIDSMTLVKEAVVRSDIIRTSIQGVVRNAQIVDTDYMSDGSVEVKVVMNMSGQLANTILPQHSPVVPWATGPSVATVTPETLKPSSDIITGLVVDARGLGARPAMSPKIVDETGKEIYGSAMVNRQYAVQQGMAGYSRDLGAAQSNSRVTANPLTVKGLRSVGPGKSDIVISNSDASGMLSAAENLLFMQKCRVMIVVD